LLALREAIAPDDRTRWSVQITAQLLAGFPQLASMVVGVY
jgi:hypothetical protein